MTPQSRPWLKPLTEYGPLVAFLVVYLAVDLFAATAALMATTVVAVALTLMFERRIPVMPVVTA